MRSIQSGFAAVITKEKLFNHRVVLGAFIILASALASYITLAAYVPSLVHAQGTQEVEKRANRAVLAHASNDSGTDETSASQEERSAGDSQRGGEESHRQDGQQPQEEGVPAQTDESTSSNEDAPTEVTAPPVAAPREVIADAPAEQESRQQDSRPSSVVTSQFRADGCSKQGTSVLRHYNKRSSWDNYGEFGNGARGNCIKSIQRKLNQYCTNKLDVDGQYGPRTSSAVRAYQHYMRSLGGITVNGNQIYVDGITGAQTFALMQEFSAKKSFLKC